MTQDKRHPYPVPSLPSPPKANRCRTQGTTMHRACRLARKGEHKTIKKEAKMSVRTNERQNDARGEGKGRKEGRGRSCRQSKLNGQFTHRPPPIRLEVCLDRTVPSSPPYIFGSMSLAVAPETQRHCSQEPLNHLDAPGKKFWI